MSKPLYDIIAADPLRSLTVQQLLLFDQVRARKRPQTLTEISERMGISLSYASRVAKRLIELGFIERRWDPDDARRHTLVSTRKGETLYARVQDYVAANSRRRALTTEDIAT